MDGWMDNIYLISITAKYKILIGWSSYNNSENTIKYNNIKHNIK